MLGEAPMVLAISKDDDCCGEKPATIGAVYGVAPWLWRFLANSRLPVAAEPTAGFGVEVVSV